MWFFMKIAIAGGSGFIGKALVDELIKEQHDIYILTRHPNKQESRPRVYQVGWLQPGAVPETCLVGLDVFINLAGESLNSGRWTKDRKRQIVESRIEAAREMHRILSVIPHKISCLINASAIGYYGTSHDEIFTEEFLESGHDFLAHTVKLWEEEASRSRFYCNRLLYTRFGLILGSKEGALPLMVLPYKLYAGGKMGRGTQWISWIHIEDAVRAIVYCLHQDGMQGPINVTAPNPVTMNDFGRTIGTVLSRPHWFPVPPFLLKAALGEKSMLVLEGQKVLPNKLMEAGFSFSHPTLKSALENLL